MDTAVRNMYRNKLTWKRFVRQVGYLRRSDFLFVLEFLQDNVHEQNSHTSRTTNVYSDTSANEWPC